VEDLQDRIAAVIDSGPCPVGVESTVLDLTGPQPVLLRPGGITLEAIEAVIGAVAHESPETSGPRSPGRLASHYAPQMPVRLNATNVADTEALLAFGPEVPEARLTVNLSERGDLLEAAARLFTGLRWLDAESSRHGMVRIAVMPIPRTGLGLAINDRLQRAAAPRPRS
jgi:L-threonylcarbamoyladenylate synthase